jgi:hypothetical protein
MSTSEENRRIEALQAAARGRSSDDREDLWAKLPAGQLTGDEEAALRAEADGSDEGRLLLELYRPFDANEKQRLFDGVHRSLQHQRDVVRRKRARWVAAGTFVAAAAAALPIYVHLHSRALLPAVQWSGSLGAHPKDHPLDLGDPDRSAGLTIVPVEPFAGTLVVRGALFVQGPRAIPWDPHPNPTSPNNEIRIAGTRRDLFPCLTGEGTLLVAVGPSGAPLSESDLTGPIENAAAGPYHVLHKSVWLGDDPVPGRDGKPCRRSAP